MPARPFPIRLISAGAALRKHGRAGSSAGFAAARGLALFLGAFTLAGLWGDLRSPGMGANLWWLDLRAVPAPLAWAGLALLGTGLAAWGIFPSAGPRRRLLTLCTLVGALTCLGLNAAIVFGLILRGTVQAGVPLPASLVFFAALGFVGMHVRAEPRRSVPRYAWLGAVFGCLLIFPLVQIVCFGRTDYRRPADVAVVFGARVYADGRLSDAVADRVRTAAQLYRQGWVREIVMSGGPGDGSVHETEAMRDAAILAGVPAAAIQLDPVGLSTAHTVRNTAARLAGRRVIAVSEYYHLPRIKLAYGRAGVEVFTVPAEALSWRRTWDLRSVLREVPAFWLYYARAVFAGG